MTNLYTLGLSTFLMILLWLQSGAQSLTDEVGKTAGIYAMVILLTKEVISFAKWLIDRKSKFSVENLLVKLTASVDLMSKNLTEAMRRQLTTDNISKYVKTKKS